MQLLYVKLWMKYDARYFLTMRSPDSHFDFDLNLPKKSHKTIQFTMLNMRMRICSILKQAKEQGVEVTADADFSTITNEKQSTY